MSQNRDGHGPVMLVAISRNLSMLVNNPKDCGIDPCNRGLYATSNEVRLASSPNELGIVPVNIFDVRVIVVKLDNNPTSGGIDPTKLLSGRTREVVPSTPISSGP